MSHILIVCNYRPGVGGISGQAETLRRKLREEGHTAELFNTRGSVPQRLAMPRKLARAARGCDVVHVHCCSGWGFLPAVMATAVGRRLGKRVVLTYHGGGAEAFFGRHPRLVRRVLTQTDCNIVLSGFLEEVFARHGLPCTVIPNIVEMESIRFRQREHLGPNYICTRAHEPLYNIGCLLRAFRRVQEARPEATLTLVGDGSEHEALKRQAAALGLKNVQFTGRVDNSEIHALLARADVLVSAPRVDNMPVSLLEAMNAGLLVVASRVGGVPYMVEEGRTGLLFESDDDRQLARQMLRAVEHPAEARDIVERARLAAEAYRWDNVKEKIYTAYGITA